MPLPFKLYAMKHLTMKASLSIFILFLCLNSTAQNLSYEIHGNYRHPVTNQQLIKAQTMTDINPGYPSSWITDYVLTEIEATCNGEKLSVNGLNDTLHDAQRKILSSADLGTDIIIDVHYRRNNAATGESQLNTLHYVATVVPETEAQYPGGNDELMKYIKENAIDKITGHEDKLNQNILIQFNINAAGEPVDARLIRTSGDQKTDKMLLKAITKMPVWKPAVLANGLTVLQQFTFSIEAMGC